MKEHEKYLRIFKVQRALPILMVLVYIIAFAITGGDIELAIMVAALTALTILFVEKDDFAVLFVALAAMSAALATIFISFFVPAILAAILTAIFTAKKIRNPPLPLWIHSLSSMFWVVAIFLTVYFNISLIGLLFFLVAVQIPNELCRHASQNRNTNLVA